MNLESQVCSLELSQKLKKLGVKQESLFNWITENQIREEWEIRVEASDYSFDCPIEIIASAFTVAELGSLLPGYYKSYCSGDKKLWFCQHQEDDIEFITETADTAANALAKMLIYLIENKLIIL